MPAADNSTGTAKGCWTRTASVNAKAFFVTNARHTALSDAVTGYITTITTEWDGLIDAAENKRRDLDLEEKIQTYITDEYLDKNSSGLSYITGQKKSTYDGLVVEMGDLKVIADAKGMDTSVVLTDYNSKTMATLKAEWDDAKVAQATAYTTW